MEKISELVDGANHKVAIHQKNHKEELGNVLGGCYAIRHKFDNFEDV